MNRYPSRSQLIVDRTDNLTPEQRFLKGLIVSAEEDGPAYWESPCGRAWAEDMGVLPHRLYWLQGGNGTGYQPRDECTHRHHRVPSKKPCQIAGHPHDCDGTFKGDAVVRCQGVVESQGNNPCSATARYVIVSGEGEKIKVCGKHRPHAWAARS